MTDLREAKATHQTVEMISTQDWLNALLPIPNGPPYYVMLHGRVDEPGHQLAFRGLRPDATLQQMSVYVTNNAALSIIVPESFPQPSKDIYEHGGFECFDGKAEKLSVRYCMSDRVNITYDDNQRRFEVWVTPPVVTAVKPPVRVAVYPARELSVEGANVHAWLLSHAGGQALLGSDTARITFMPASSPIWSEIKDLTPKQAIAEVQRKIDASKVAWSVLGLTIPEDLVLIAAPIALLVLALYYNANVLHLIRLDKEDSHNGKKHFPWILLFPTTWRQPVTWGLLLLLPCISVVLLLESRETESSSLVRSIMAVVTIMLAVTAMASARLTDQFASTIGLVDNRRPVDAPGSP
jgi:hypothetical protein